jgi:hypothetical protein
VEYPASAPPLLLPRLLFLAECGSLTAKWSLVSAVCGSFALHTPSFVRAGSWEKNSPRFRQTVMGSLKCFSVWSMVDRSRLSKAWALPWGIPRCSAEIRLRQEGKAAWCARMDTKRGGLLCPPLLCVRIWSGYTRRGTI